MLLRDIFGGSVTIYLLLGVLFWVLEIVLIVEEHLDNYFEVIEWLSGFDNVNS